MADLGDLQRGIERVSDQIIRDAQEDGAFNNLPGAGKPIPDIDQPFDQNWFLRRWVKRERLQNPTLQDELRQARSEPPR